MLSKENLEGLYNELAEHEFPDGERIKFIDELGASNELAYHYELICKEWEEDKDLYLDRSFDRHGRDGLEFLFDRLNGIEDERLKVFTVYLIAGILSKLRHMDFYLEFCKKLNPILASLLEINDNTLRHKIIIAFGWIGSVNDIDILTNKILTDEDSLCRAWAASSLMQMSFFGLNQDILREKTKSVFIKAIKDEKDLYACGIMIESAQTLFGKKWISSSAVENIDIEKIEKAKKSAIRFLSKG